MVPENYLGSMFSILENPIIPKPLLGHRLQILEYSWLIGSSERVNIMVPNVDNWGVSHLPKKHGGLQEKWDTVSLYSE